MGMFDQIKCNYPLPNTPSVIQNDTFQTKDFYNAMDDYVITSEGRLLHKKYNWEIVPEKERPYYGKSEWNKNPLFQMIGSLKRTDEEVVDIEFHGILNMYTHVNGMWYEYNIKFTDGNVVEIKRIYDND